MSFFDRWRGGRHEPATHPRTHGASIASTTRSAAELNGTPAADALAARTFEAISHLHSRLLDVDDRDQLIHMGSETLRELLGPHQEVLLLRQPDGSHRQFRPSTVPAEAVDVLIELAGMWFASPTAEPVVVADTAIYRGLGEHSRSAFQRADIASFVMAPVAMPNGASCVVAVAFDRAGHPGLANVEGIRLAVQATLAALRRVSSLEALQRSESSFRDAAEANPSEFAILAPILDDDGYMVDAEYVFTNAAARRALEKSCGDGDVPLYSIAFPDPARFTSGMERFRAALRRNERVESISRDDFPGPGERWIRSVVLPTAQGNLSVTVRDITIDIQAQRAVEEADERFQAAADANADAFLILEPEYGSDGNVTDYTIAHSNEHARLALLGEPEGRVARLRDVLGPDQFEPALAAHNHVLTSGRPADDVVTLARPGDGASETWYRRRLVAHGGRLLATYHDITHEKRQEAESAENTRRLHAAADANRDAFMLMEPVRDDSGAIVDFAIVFTNRTARRIRRGESQGPPATARELVAEQHFEAVLTDLVSVLESGVTSVKEISLEHDGRVTWYERHVTSLGSALVVVYRDVTAFRREIAELGAAEADRRAVLDGLSDIIAVGDMDPEGVLRISYANPAFRTFFGIADDQDPVGRAAAGLLDPKIGKILRDRRLEAVAAGQPVAFEFTGVVNGEQRWVNACITPIFDANGECQRVIWRGTDFTAEKRAAEQATALHGRLAAAAEANPDAFGILDPVRDASGTIVDFAVVFENEGAKSLRMQYNAPARGRLLSDLSDISPEGFERMLGAYVETLETGVPREDELVEDDLGERRWYLRRLVPLGGSVVAVYRDITARTLEMQSLARAEAEKEAILSSLTDLICVAEPDQAGEFVITYANRAYLEFMGLEREQVIGRPRVEFQDPELGRLYDDVRTEAIESRQPLSRELQAEINGRTRHASVLVTPIFDETGACSRVIWRVTDLTEEREAREESERAMANQRAVLDGLTDFVYLLDRDKEGEFRFTYANEAVYRRGNADALMGRRLQELPGMEDGGSSRIALLRRCVETRAPATGEFTLDISGRPTVLDILATPLVDEDGEVTRVIWRASDVTGRRASERRFEAVATATTDPFSLLDPVYGPKGEIVDFAFRYSNETGKAFNREYSGVETPARLSELFAPRPEGFPAELAIYVNVVNTGEPYEAEVRTLDLAGNVHWLWRQIIPVEGGVVATGRDITERKQQTEALANAEQIQRATLEGLSDSIVVNDRQPDGRFKTVVANQAYARGFGLTLDQVLDRYPEDYLPEGRIGPLAELSKEAVRSREPRDLELTVLEEGRTVHRLTRVIPFFNEQGQCIRTIWRSTDVTDLRTVERRFKAAAEASIDSLMIFEPVVEDGTIVDFSIVYHNQRSKDRLSEWGRQLPTNLRELTQNNEAMFAEAIYTYTAVIASGRPHSSQGTRQLNGGARWYRRELVPVDNAIVATFRDVTDQQEERNALEEAEARLRAILDGLADAVVVADRDEAGNFPVSYANRAFFDLVGLEPADVYGRRAREFLPDQSNEVAWAAFAEVMASGTPTTREITATIGGREITAAALITPVFDDEGECTRIIWRLTDRTGQHVSEARFKAAAEANLDGFMIMDPIRDADGVLVDFQITFANAAARDGFYPTPDGSEVRTLRDMCVQDETRFSRALSRFTSALEKGEPSDEEVSSDTSGQVRWYQRQLVPFGNGLIVTYRDITRAKNARLELEAGERNLRAILEGLSDAVVVSDRDRNGDFPITYVNPAFLDLLGIPPGEIVDHSVTSFLPPELAELVYRTRLEAIEAGEPIERPVSGTVRGKALDLEARITPVFDSTGICDRLLWRLNDVSGAHRRQEEAEAAERNLRTILENLTDGIIVSDRDRDGEFRISYIHPVPAMAGRFQIDRMIGKTWAELYEAEEAEEREAIAARVMESMAPVDFDLVYPIDDGEVHLAGRASPVVDSQGAVGRIIWRYTDVTEAYERQRDTERAERNQRAILDGIADHLYVLDRGEDGEFRFTYANEAAIADYGAELTQGKRIDEAFGLEEAEPRLALLHRALETRRPQSTELTYSTEGRRQWLAMSVSPVVGPDGSCDRVIWRATDITERAEQQRRIEESERLQSAILGGLADFLYVFDRDPDGEFRYSYLNAAAIELSKRRDTVPIPIGLRMEDVMQPEEAAQRNEMFDRAIRSRSAVSGEVSRVLNDGAVGWASTMVTPIFDEDGSCNRIIFRATNTTEARRRQREIEENERNWRAILDALTDVLVVMDRPGDDEPFRVSYLNAAREALTGRPDSQLMGKTIDEFLDRDGSRRFGTAIESAIEQHHYLDFEGTTTDRNGDPLAFSARITPVYQPDGECRRVIVRYNDITLSRQTEQQLQQSEQSRKAIVDSLADIVLLLDADEQGEFRLSFANQPFFDTGRTPEATLGKRFVDFLTPEEAARRQAMFEEAVASGGPIEGEVSAEVNGRTIHFITRVTPIFDEQGACVRSVWRYTDISELVHQRERLEASDREQRAVLDGLSDAIVVVDLQPDGRWLITRANDRHAEMIGQPPGSLHGLALSDLARTSGNAARSYSLLLRALASRTIVEDESETAYSGREIIAATRVTPLFDDDGDCYRCIFRISDVTEARHREAMVNRLGRAIDGASDEIYIINGTTFEIDQVNAGARANLGYSDEELATMTVIDLVVEPPPDELVELVAPLAMGEVGMIEMNATHRRKDGSTYPVEARLQVIEQNNVPVLLATIRDISLRQRMEESLARLAAIVESSADAVIGLDNDGLISHWNAAAADMFGYPETSARGSDLATVFASSESGAPQLARIVRDGGSADVVLRRHDGTRVDVSATAFPVHAGDGHRLGTAIVARDIRWRVEATRALRESERRFRSIFDQAPEGILIQRADNGTILDVNQRLLDMVEWGREDLAGRRPIELGLVSDPEAVMELDRALNAGQPVAPQEMSVLTRKGRTIEVLVTVEVIELNGERCFLSFLSDISRLKSTERELLRAQESLRSITQNLPVILTSWDADERCTFAAGLGLELAGLEGDALIGRHLQEIVGPSSQVDSAVATAHAGDSGSLEFSLAGRIFEAQYRVLPDRTTVSVAVDVTEVRTTTRQLETIVENMPITFLAFDADGIITICKGSAQGLLVSEASVGRSMFDVYESRPRVLADLERVLAGERFSSSYTSTEGRALEVHYSPVRAAEGDLAGAAIVIIDVTDRLRAEQAVRETNERFRQMAETATDGIVSANRSGRIVFANEAMSTIFGYDPDELMDQSLTMLMPSELAGSHRSGFSRYLQTREKSVNWKSLELTGRRKDGTEFTIEMSLSEGVLDGEPVITAFIRDITERRRTEEALMQAQKLESLGVLAGGIAHDFNNMLVAIMGNAGLALAELPTESPARETVQEIELAARRAAELARQMLAYSGKGRLTVNTVDLTSLVEEIPHLLRTSIGKGVTLRYSLARDIPPVEADATQLRQVVMNLVINASDAIGDDEGVIAITTGSIEADREQLRSAHVPGDLEPGLYCYLEVTDTGSGMSPDTLARIFDPFFTTKFTGKGLGLAAVLGIVRGHKGTIKVESTEGEGTTFRLLLPASPRARSESDPPAPVQEQWKGTGTILVVDDEDSVRHVTSRAVRTMGFDVIAAVDGQEASELFKDNHESLAAVIMDLTMPHMNGETAAGIMRDIDPAVPIILMSGFDEGEMATRFRDAGIAEFVQKPFEIRTLRDAVRHAVGEPE